MLYTYAEYILDLVEYETICIIAILPIIYIILNKIYNSEFDIISLALLFILLPVSTPALTTYSGFEYFTAMNRDIQTPELIVSALILILLFALSVSIGASFKGKDFTFVESPLKFSEPFFYFVMILNFVLFFSFIESGNIIFSDYGSLKMIETPYSSIVQQFFNLSFACIISTCVSDRRKKLIKYTILFLILFALVISKRNLAVGLGVIYLYQLTGGHLTRKQIGYIIVGVGLLYFIGQARSVGVLNYINGVEVEIVDYYSPKSGGANIFLSTVGSIHLILFGNLDQWEKFPIFYIFQGIGQGSIYESHGYSYNGGMHLAATLYWNFGLLGVIIGGLGFGKLLTMAHQGLAKMGGHYTGGISLTFYIILTLLLSSILWYGPLGIIKAGAALFIFALVLKVLTRTKFKRI